MPPRDPKPKLPSNLHDLALGEASTCPRGMIRRKAFTRADGTTVEASCVPDLGKPGKTPPSGRVLPKPEPGALEGWSHEASASERHRTLRRVSRKDGCGTVIKRLNLIATFTKRTSPATKRAAQADMKWLRGQGFCSLKGKGRK